jgi:hypothetical protein
MMEGKTGERGWRIYERIVAAVQVEESGIDLSLTPNAEIIGCITGVRRQIDVLIDARWGDDGAETRTIVDAKHYRSKLDVKDVESFEGMMKDCRARRGILVCPNGASEAARRRARDAITITLLSTDDVDEFPWAQFDPCVGQCAESRNAEKGLVLWDGQFPVGLEGTWLIVWSGKCDRCHNFHVWCWDCGEKFALGDEDEHICDCGYRWATVIEQEPSGDEVINAVRLILLIGEHILALDRRSLR